MLIVLVYHTPSPTTTSSASSTHFRTLVRSTFAIILCVLRISLTRNDILTCTYVEQQLRPVSIHPTLTALQHLTIRHVEMRTASDVTRLCTWIRHLLRHSSLRSLALLSEHPSRGVSPAFDGLAQHIAFRHFRTITTLSLATAFVGREALRTLCSNCVHIEELAVAVTADVLVSSR